MMAGPRWREIADDLRARINAGEFATEDSTQQRGANQLPTEARLQEFYGDISRNTVRQAIDFLVSRRIVEKQAGRGTFVVEEIKPFVANLTVGQQTETVGYHEGAKREGRAARTSAPRVELERADEWLSGTLGIEQGEQVVVRRQQRFIDERPFSLQTSYYPMSFVNGGATELLMVSDIPRGAIAYLKEKLGIKEAGTVDRISARAPDSSEAAFFGLPDVGSVAMLEHRRTTFDKDGNPVRVTVTTYPADRNEFEIFTGSVPPRPSMATEQET
jgi:GntR family transcriptional regulator